MRGRDRTAPGRPRPKRRPGNLLRPCPRRSGLPDRAGDAAASASATISAPALDTSSRNSASDSSASKAGARLRRAFRRARSSVPERQVRSSARRRFQAHRRARALSSRHAVGTRADRKSTPTQNGAFRAAGLSARMVLPFQLPIGTAPRRAFAGSRSRRRDRG